MTSRKCQFGGAKVRLGDICRKGKSSLRLKDLEHDGQYAVYGASGIVGMMDSFQNDEPYVSVIKDGAGVGRAFACEARTSVLGTMQALLPKEGVERDYLLHLVRSLKLGDGFTGSTIPHIYFKDYCKRQVFLSNLDAQRRIVQTLSSIENQILQIDDELSKLDILIKSRFVEMFDPGKHGQCAIGDLLSGIVSGTNAGGNQRPLKDGEYGVLKISAVTKGVFDSGEYKVVDDVSTIKMIHLRKGDLLFSRANTAEMVGATAIVDQDYGDLFLPDKLWRLDPKPGIDAVFLKALLSSDRLRAEMTKVATGTSGSMKNISMAKFRELPAFMPSAELQRDFVAFVSHIDKLRVLIQQQKEKLQMLYDSLAQEYFAV